jgi:hypothetical protein
MKNQISIPVFTSGTVTTVSSPPINFKYDERTYLDEFTRYVEKTYGEHYAKDKIEALEFIIDSGNGTGFNIGNIMKYAKRYGKKGEGPDEWRKDLMKIAHYALIQLYVHDVENRKEG